MLITADLLERQPSAFYLTSEKYTENYANVLMLFSVLYDF